jgi:hypothetical protein
MIKDTPLCAGDTFTVIAVEGRAIERTRGDD